MLLRVCEIFRSIQGETRTAGFPSLFIRLAGCNLNCAWCDTPRARDGTFTEISVERLAALARGSRGIHHVTLTGGEPLLQAGTPELVRALPEGTDVQVETNGSLPVGALLPHARVIMDVKTPSSGEAGSVLKDNIPLLRAEDEVKFVIADAEDYRYAAGFMARELAGCPAAVNLSPARGRMDARALAEMMLRDGLRARLNLQLHAIIWDNSPDEGEKINLANLRG